MSNRTHRQPSPGRTPSCWILWLLAGASLLSAADWPQWRGPSRDGRAPEFEPPSEWPAELRQVWQVEVGEGHASPLVVGDRVLLHSRIEDREAVSALALADGSVLWRQSYDAPYEPISVAASHGKGPFSTPAAADGRLFTYGITEILSAWDLTSGELLWRRSFGGQFKFPHPFYGTSNSPLVTHGKLILHVGGPGDGALLALDPASGEELWRWQGDGPAYGSPVVVEREGTRQLVTLTQRNLIGVELETGRLLWQEPFQVSYDNTALTPLVVGETFVLSAAGLPARALRLRASNGEWSVEEVWSNDTLPMAFSSPVLAGGRLFAFTERNKGQLVTVSPSNGARLWSSDGRLGENAYLVAAGEVVFVLYDDGQAEVHAVAAEGYAPLARYELASSPVWAHPALFSDKILIKDRRHLTLWAVD